MAEQKQVREAKVDKYEERPLKDALAKESEIKKVENRDQPDQIEDYHKKNPTLKQPKAVEEAVAEDDVTKGN